MTISRNTPLQTSPPAIERVGALCSLLIHDLANHLSVINGNAQFVQLFANDPQRAAPALAAILKASEAAANLLTRCSELRRGLSGAFPSGNLSLLAKALSDFPGRCPGWSANASESMSGRVALPEYWVAFLAFEFARSTTAETGSISLARCEAKGRTPPIGLAGAGSRKDVLEIKLAYRSDRPFPFDEIRAQHSNLDLLAAYELVKLAGGTASFGGPSSTDQEIAIRIPLLDDEEG